MSDRQFYFPFKPRIDDPLGHNTVQKNLELFAGMFDKGTDTGDVPTWDQPTGRWTSAPGTAVPIVGTTLPASPKPFQIAIVFDSLTSPTYAWSFIYISTITDAYKWVCFGTQYFQHRIVTEENIGGSGTWNNLATDGPLFTVPFAGIYDCYAQANAANSAATIQSASIGITISDTTPSEPVPANLPVGTRQIESLWKEITAVATNVIKVRYFTAASVQIDFGYRILRVAPKRVSG